MRRKFAARALCLAIPSVLAAGMTAWRHAPESLAPADTIAFKSFAPNNADIFIADGDGQRARALVPHPALDYDASFSSDGRWIVFTSHRSGPAKIYRVHPDGSGLERLTDGPAFDDQATLSPDGSLLAFVSTRAGQADIWIKDLVTGQSSNLTPHPAGDFRPAWSPDGQWLAFSSDRDPIRTSCPNTTAGGPGPFVTPQYTAVFVMRRDGSGLRRVTAPGEVAGTPHWSLDGRRLVYWAGEADQVCRGGLILGIGTTQLISMDMKSEARDTLTAAPVVAQRR